MAPRPPEAGQTNFQAGVQTVREAAKWVLTSLAGVGTLLVAGIGLSALADVHNSTRLVWSAIAVLVALIGVGWGVAQTARVLAPSSVKFSNIVAAEQSHNAAPYMADVFDRKSVVLEGFGTDFADLDSKFATARDERATTLVASYNDPKSEPKERAANAAVAKFNMYRDVIERIVANAAYHEVRSRLSTTKQILAAAIVALGVASFAVLVAWPETPSPSADFHGATLVGVNLSGTSLVSASFTDMALTLVQLEQADLRNADFKGAKLENVNLEGAHTAGANFEEATYVNVTCPDGTNSDEAGATCAAHGAPPKSER